MDARDRHEDQTVEYDVSALRSTLLTYLGEQNQSSYPKAIEAKFPRILARIVELWGKPEFEAYLDSLMVADRTGRQGFSGDVAMEVFRLSTLYGSLGLALKKAQGTGWAGVEDAELHKHHVTRE